MQCVPTRASTPEQGVRGAAYAAPVSSPIPDDVRAAVQAIHDAPAVAVLAVTGAGASALTWLFAVPGASRTVLEARVPYARATMIELLGSEPADYVSAATAAAMARAAIARARALQGLDHAGAPSVGFACTATIATDRTKRGEHRVWVAVADGTRVACSGLVLAKGERDRAGEEDVVARLAIRALAAACGVAARGVALPLLAGERVETREEPA